MLVAPERFATWVSRFEERHGALEWSSAPTHVLITAADGASARCEPPFAPLLPLPAADDPATALDGLSAHVLRERTVGVLLVRLGGYATGVFVGARLDRSKVGSRHVQGRSAAGGWSQQRFARRREAQGRVAFAAAAEVAARVLVPEVPRLEAVVVGGSRRAVDAVLADGRLAALRPLVTRPFLDVPDPRLAVLERTPQLFRAVPIDVVDAPRAT